ncbi:MAG: alpha-2-macroglobulin, partial [Chloroflexota bacterium]
VVASVADDGGRQQSSSSFMWVADIDAVGWPTDPRDKRMDLAADKEDYRPGDTARILVQSPFVGPANAWLTIERGDVIDQRLVTLQSDSEVLEIPISPSYAPNVFVTVHVVKGVDESNLVADMRIGVTELVVSPEQLALNMILTPKSDLLSPGDTAEYDLLVTDHLGNPVQANFSLALVDLAVLSLKADNAPHIVEAFYRRQPLRSQTGAGLIVSGEGLEVEIPSEILGRGGGGGGGADETAAAAVTLQGEEDEQGEDVRADFQDTAFWQAQVSTDPSGRATVSIPLPDNVTTWRLSSKGVSDYATSNETLVGQTEADIVSNLPLLIRPITPRFFTVGDDLSLGAVIHNNTAEQLDVAVSLEAAGLTLTGPAEQELTIAPGQRQVVRWPVMVNDVPFADLTFRAEAGQYRDATKPTFGRPPDQLIPIVRYAGEDVVGTSGILDEADRRVEAILLPEEVDTRQGAVEIELSPSLAAALTTSLRVVNYLEDRPACAHATADQLLPNVATMRAYQGLPLPGFDQAGELERLIVDGISNLERLQKSNGGWGWCYSTRSDPFLSGHVLFALAMAQDAGFDIDGDVLDGGVRYIQNQILDAADLSSASKINRQAFFLYVLAELGQADTADLDALFDEHRALLDPYAKALLAMAFDLNGQRAQAQSLLGDLNDSAILSAAGAHWQDAEPDWDNLNSDIRGTAMVLETLTRLDPNGPLAPNAVRWLMVARRAGHWPTGHDTAWSIMALADWMAVSGELEADYDYQVDVNADRLANGGFDSDNVTDNEELSVPVSQLLPDEVNYLAFQRSEGPGRLYYTAYLDSFINAENLEPLARGFSVERTYYDASCDPSETVCQPIDELKAGQEVRVELTIVVHNDGVYVVVADPIPAGAEAVDPGLAISDPGQGGRIERADESFRHGFWGWWHFNNIEYRDDSVVFTSEFLPAGTYQYSYTLQTAIPGTYQVIPATARLEFFPDVFGRSGGSLFEITE